MAAAVFYITYAGMDAKLVQMLRALARKNAAEVYDGVPVLKIDASTPLFKCDTDDGEHGRIEAEAVEAEEVAEEVEAAELEAWLAAGGFAPYTGEAIRPRRVRTAAPVVSVREQAS